eukprot:211681-Pyramimonas_sp.AAC.1
MRTGLGKTSTKAGATGRPDGDGATATRTASGSPISATPGTRATVQHEHRQGLRRPREMERLGGLPHAAPHSAALEDTDG